MTVALLSPRSSASSASGSGTTSCSRWSLDGPRPRVAVCEERAARAVVRPAVIVCNAFYDVNGHAPTDPGAGYASRERLPARNAGQTRRRRGGPSCDSAGRNRASSAASGSPPKSRPERGHHPANEYERLNMSPRHMHFAPNTAMKSERVTVAEAPVAVASHNDHALLGEPR